MRIVASSITVYLGATRKVNELPNEGQALSSSISSFFLSLSYCLAYTKAGICSSATIPNDAIPAKILALVNVSITPILMSIIPGMIR
jgi:hypothetical protein